MTDAPETDASFLAPVSGAGFWSVCQGYYALYPARFPIPLAQSFLLRRFSFRRPLCTFRYYIYLLTYLLTYLLQQNIVEVVEESRLEERSTHGVVKNSEDIRAEKLSLLFFFLRLTAHVNGR